MTLTLVTTTLDWNGVLTDLIPQIQAHLQSYGTPLRWAITAVCGRTLTIEAVVIQS
ncbi:MAG: hypothetical protein RMI89_00095 [Gloeomargarita sp. SKYBB_i_bin120]|nr:hypothetical protein [Gloeomargarita sp. SKYG98]MCS7291364.1 hypothetical protein [Gloeomargarita sp. SKYB120]MDW8176923.1 hypothetical protein [Gloeomargarita sp. SKYBB_i_bin120]